MTHMREFSIVLGEIIISVQQITEDIFKPVEEPRREHPWGSTGTLATSREAKGGQTDGGEASEAARITGMQG